MNHITIVIFGITGDLARRKLIPAICKLIEHNHLESFLIIGIGKEPSSPEKIMHHASDFTHSLSTTAKEKFMHAFFYQTIDISDASSFSTFANFIQQTEKSHGMEKNDRIAYCATASNLFIPIINGLAHFNTIRPNSNDKIIFEKPFGKSKNDAEKINACIRQHWNEKQIFRVDHYLGKELVRTLLNIRFSNSIFENQLNNHYVEQVHIIAREKIGIEGRVIYYDAYGAVKDMIQNHLLSLLALLTLEKPITFDSNSISQGRHEILKQVVFQDGLLGQCKQYKEEEGIDPKSKTETFAALVFHIQNSRWKGVPFYIETGKYLAQKETLIRIKFKKINDQQSANWLTIQMAPDSRISLSLHIKSPKSRDEIITVPMEFCHSCVFGSESPESYETLLYEILLGNRWSAITPEEIESAWDIAEKIAKENFPLSFYERGSNGPAINALCDRFDIDLV